MKATALNKEIYNKAKKFGIESITLHFSGGNDEGFLDVELENEPDDCDGLREEIENWAWETYSYNGAGEGYDYGDDITYDLKNNKVLTSVWYMSRKEELEGSEYLSIEQEDEE